MCINILKQSLLSSADKLGIHFTFKFYHDNDPKHKAYKTREWLSYNCPHVDPTSVPWLQSNGKSLGSTWLRNPQNPHYWSSSHQRMLTRGMDQNPSYLSPTIGFFDAKTFGCSYSSQRCTYQILDAMTESLSYTFVGFSIVYFTVSMFMLHPKVELWCFSGCNFYVLSFFNVFSIVSLIRSVTMFIFNKFNVYSLFLTHFSALYSFFYRCLNVYVTHCSI